MCDQKIGGHEFEPNKEQFLRNERKKEKKKRKKESN